VHGVYACVAAIEIVVLHQRVGVQSLIVDEWSTIPPTRETASFVDSGGCADRAVFIIVVEVRVALWIAHI